MPGRRGIRCALARVYDRPDPNGSAVRILVDRLWPRGVRRDDGVVDEWIKDVAPSPDLRRWYAHDPAKFAEFRQRYLGELRQPPAADAVAQIRDLGRSKRIVLLTATRDTDHSGARVLRDLLASGAR